MPVYAALGSTRYCEQNATRDRSLDARKKEKRPKFPRSTRKRQHGLTHETRPRRIITRHRQLGAIDRSAKLDGHLHVTKARHGRLNERRNRRDAPSLRPPHKRQALCPWRVNARDECGYYARIGRRVLR